MQHVYRQVTGLQDYRTVVLTEDRTEETLYPFEHVEVLPPARLAPHKRLFRKFLLREPSLVYRGGVDAIRSVTDRYPDVGLMHVYFGHSGVHLLPFIERWDRPVVVSFHGMDAMPRLQHKNYLPSLRRLFAHIPLVLVRSHSLGKVLVERGCPQEKIRINRTSVPLDGFTEVDRGARSMPGQGITIIQASRLIEKKGLDLTLAAFAEFHSTNPGAQLVIVGEGPLLGELREKARSLGIAQFVDFTGFLNPRELAARFTGADIFIHPSRVTSAQDQEGVPNSMLEAMATGLPVIATRHGGIPEVVKDGQHGFLCAENDTPALVGALHNLARDRELRFKQGADAARMVREEFSPHRSIQALESCYDEARKIWSASRGGRGKLIPPF